MLRIKCPFINPPQLQPRAETLTVTCPPWDAWSCSSLSALPNTAETHRGHTPDLDLGFPIDTVPAMLGSSARPGEEMAGLKDRQTDRQPSTHWRLSPKSGKQETGSKWKGASSGRPRGLEASDRPEARHCLPEACFLISSMRARCHPSPTW